MRTAILLSCLLGFGLGLFGQDGDSSIEGRVVNAATGAPLRNATVTLRLLRVAPSGTARIASPGGPYTAPTDERGRFAFGDLPPGGYQLSAQRQGYLDPNRGQISMSSPGIIMLGEDQQLTGVVVRLTPQSVISGKVRDRRGEPVAGAQVVALRWGYSNGKRQLTRATIGAFYSTNDLGEYRIAGLAAGSYFVMAAPTRVNAIRVYSPEQPLPEKPDLVNTRTYYPAALDAAGATLVRVTAGAERRKIDIKLVETRGVNVRGQVIDSGARSNSPTPVTLRPRGGADATLLSGTMASSSSGGGSFLITGVPPGSYSLVARRGEGQELAGAVLPIEVADKNLDGITITVLPAVDVQVGVKSEAAGRCLLGYLSLSEESGSFAVRPTNIGGDTKSLIKSVVPGTYTLNISSGSPCYVQAVRFGGRDVAGMQVKVDGSGPLEITLAASGARVDGTVTDSAGRQLNRGTVTFLPKDGVLSNNRTTAVSRAGGFALLGLRPGAYDVFAWESVDYASAQSAEYLKQFEGRGKSITVEAGGRQTIQLTVIPASATGALAPMVAQSGAKGSIEGRVINAVTGATLSGVTVTLGTRQANLSSGVAASGAVVGMASQGPAQLLDRTAETDAQGRFAFPDVEPEIYYISAQGQGFANSGVRDRPNMIGAPITVGDGQRIGGFTIKLAPQSVIAGRVTDEIGEAVANAQASLYHPEYVRGMRILSRVATAQADNLGKFRLTSLPPGSYYLGVTKPVQVRPAPSVAQQPPNEPETGYGTVWYPNALDVAGASPIAVGSEAEVPIEIVLRRTRVVRLRGTFVDAEGNPRQRGDTVMLYLRGLWSGVVIGYTVPGRDGAFEITNVPAGSYALSARAFDLTPPQLAYLPVEVRDASVEGIRLQSTLGREVHGTMRLEGGGALSAVVMLSSSQGLTAPTSGAMPDGTFVLRGVWPMPYALTLMNQCQNCYLKSVRYGGREVSEAAIDLAGDGELEILVSTAAASLDGVALDRQGRPAAGATVMLAPADGPGLVLSGKAGANGNFHFGGLRPGAYRAYAWEGAAPEAIPEALVPFQGRASTVKLQENAREKMQLATIQR